MATKTRATKKAKRVKTCAVNTNNGKRGNSRLNGEILAAEEKNERVKRTIKVVDTVLSDVGVMEVHIENTTPLIMCRYGSVSYGKTSRKEQGAGEVPQAKRGPEGEALDALHVIGKRPKKWSDIEKGGYRFGFPVFGAKASIVACAKQFKTHKTDARMFFWVNEDEGDLIEIIAHEPPYIRTDPVRNKSNNMTEVYRPCFNKWTAVLRIEYFARLVTAERLASWIRLAGQANGWGALRPTGRASSGNYGKFKVVGCTVNEPAHIAEEEEGKE